MHLFYFLQFYLHDILHDLSPASATFVIDLRILNDWYALIGGRMNMSMTADEEVADEQTDEMIQILVNTAKNTSSRTAPRERKRTRNTNRKSRK